MTVFRHLWCLILHDKANRLPSDHQIILEEGINVTHARCTDASLSHDHLVD